MRKPAVIIIVTCQGGKMALKEKILATMLNDVDFSYLFLFRDSMPGGESCEIFSRQRKN